MVQLQPISVAQLSADSDRLDVYFPKTNIESAPRIRKKKKDNEVLPQKTPAIPKNSSTKTLGKIQKTDKTVTDKVQESVSIENTRTNLKIKSDITPAKKVNLKKLKDRTQQIKNLTIDTQKQTKNPEQTKPDSDRQTEQCKVGGAQDDSKNDVQAKQDSTPQTEQCKVDAQTKQDSAARQIEACKVVQNETKNDVQTKQDSAAQQTEQCKVDVQKEIKNDDVQAKQSGSKRKSRPRTRRPRKAVRSKSRITTDDSSSEREKKSHTKPQSKSDDPKKPQPTKKSSTSPSSHQSPSKASIDLEKPQRKSAKKCLTPRSSHRSSSRASSISSSPTPSKRFKKTKKSNRSRSMSSSSCSTSSSGTSTQSSSTDSNSSLSSRRGKRSLSRNSTSSDSSSKPKHISSDASNKQSKRSSRASSTQSVNRSPNVLSMPLINALENSEPPLPCDPSSSRKRSRSPTSIHDDKGIVLLELNGQIDFSKFSKEELQHMVQDFLVPKIDAPE